MSLQSLSSPSQTSAVGSTSPAQLGDHLPFSVQSCTPSRHRPTPAFAGSPVKQGRVSPGSQSQPSSIWSLQSLSTPSPQSSVSPHSGWPPMFSAPPSNPDPPPPRVPSSSVPPALDPAPLPPPPVSVSVSAQAGIQSEVA